jgi:ribosome-associated protein
VSPRWCETAAGSPATVGAMDDPVVVNDELELPLAEIDFRPSRSSGPGGQHANVTASRIEAVFDVEASQSLTEAQRARLLEKLGDRVSAVAQDARSQARNRELALERLRDKLAAALVRPKKRRRTKPSRAAKERRLEEKRRTSQRKAERRRPQID